MIARCKSCGEKSPAEKCATRTDGFAECSVCGGICELEAPKAEDVVAAAKDDGKAVSPEMKALLEKQAEKKAKAEAPPDGLKPKFCAECGAELTWAKGLSTFVYPCGHTKEHGIVNDANLANKPGTAPAGHQTRAAHALANPPSPGPGGVVVESSPRGIRLFIPWGEARMPIDRFNNFKCGGHSMTVDVPDGADPVAVAKDTLRKLEKIADLMFERQKEWYEKKLGILGVTE